MNKNESVISLKNISIAYFEKNVLENISLCIYSGERVAIVGPSGVGKTTLLKKIYQDSNRNLSFIHQQYSLVPQLSVFHNIYIGQLDSHSTFYHYHPILT